MSRLVKGIESSLRASLLGKLRRGKVVYMLVGTWSGYSSSQSRVVHRVYIPEKSFGLYKPLTESGITFTDNTLLLVAIYEIKKREHLLPEIHGYDDLISEAMRYGKYNVAAICAAEEAEKKK